MKQGRTGQGGYEHTIVKIEMSIIKGLVREGAACEQGRSVIQCCKHLEHKGVGGRGGFDLVGQYEVKGVDNHGVRKDGSSSIVCHGVKMIPSRESISRSHVSARGDFPDDIKILKKKGPLSLPLREFTRIFEIGQVFMISEDRDRVRGPLQILLPLGKGKDNGKEFPIIDVVVVLGQREGFRKISTGMKIPCCIELH